MQPFPVERVRNNATGVVELPSRATKKRYSAGESAACNAEGT